MDEERINLYNLTLPALEGLVKELGQPGYRAKQIWTWLYQHLATEFDEMTVLPKTLRESLEDVATIYVPPVLAQEESLDGETRKDLLEMRDGEQVEVVLMRYTDRRSACLSTQVGCNLRCEFCATGQMGYRRDLTSGEIVVQALHVERDLQARGLHLTNIVFMGMGEPFLNYDNTLEAIYRLNHPDGFKFGQRRMTVSTAGVVPGILRFAKEDTQVNLAISLHAATDEVRNRLMPLNRRYPINDLLAAVGTYIAATNRQVTLEWVLIEGLTDTPEQAAALAARVEGMLVHVNLIPLNPTSRFAGQPPSPERIQAFVEVLERHHISHSVRQRRGIDIRAGCGQLRSREGKGT
jgi:23S rRNA (adenine2503-C2)-methyltransferase